MSWVRLPPRTRCTTLFDKVCQRLTAGGWFSPGLPVSSTNKADRHDIAEILLKVALNTQKNKINNKYLQSTISVPKIYSIEIQLMRTTCPESNIYLSFVIYLFSVVKYKISFFSSPCTMYIICICLHSTMYIICICLHIYLQCIEYV
jgi:hypothetical protein